MRRLEEFDGAGYDKVNIETKKLSKRKIKYQKALSTRARFTHAHESFNQNDL